MGTFLVRNLPLGVSAKAYKSLEFPIEYTVFVHMYKIVFFVNAFKLDQNKMKS